MEKVVTMKNKSQFGVNGEELILINNQIVSFKLNPLDCFLVITEKEGGVINKVINVSEISQIN